MTSRISNGAGNIRNILEVRNVSKHFGGVNAVESCSFQVEEGKITSLIGPKCAGKTTAFNIITGVIRSDTGRIFLDGKDITRKQVHEIALSGISRTFQQARLFKNLSVLENLTIASSASPEAIKELLASMHFYKDLSTPCCDLSYGQQRIVEIARALLFEHKLLLLDEPTAGLNQKARQELKNILRNLKKKKSTILLIEHDMDFVMDISDEVIVMAQGMVLTRGPPCAIRKDPKVLEVYLGK